MNYRSKTLQLKVLKRKFHRELRDNQEVVALGVIVGIFIGLNLFYMYI